MEIYFLVKIWYFLVQAKTYQVDYLFLSTTVKIESLKISLEYFLTLGVKQKQTTTNKWSKFNLKSLWDRTYKADALLKSSSLSWIKLSSVMNKLSLLIFITVLIRPLIFAFLDNREGGEDMIIKSSITHFS